MAAQEEEKQKIYILFSRFNRNERLEPRDMREKTVYVYKPDGIISRDDVIRERAYWDTGNVRNILDINCVVVLQGQFTIQPFAFAGMLNLKMLVLYANLSAKTDIGEHAFDSCFNLEKVINGGYAKSLGECCFKNCRLLKPFDLPEDLNIRVNAFDGCSDDCRLYMLRQIADPRYQKAVFWPILTSDKEPEGAEEAKKAEEPEEPEEAAKKSWWERGWFSSKKLSEPYRTNRFRF